MPKKKKSKKKKKNKKKSSRPKKRVSKAIRKIKKSSKKNQKKRKKKKIISIEKSPVQELIIKTRPEWIKSSLANKSQYQNRYKESIKNNNVFWKKEGKRITWIKPYKKIKDVKYSSEEVRIKWFEDGTLNASANCIDRNLIDK